MNRKALSLLCALLALCLLLPPVDCFAKSGDGLYVCSEPIPADVTAYARDQFQHINGGDIEVLNFPKQEAEDLRLAPGFTIQPCDAPITSYYFMIFCGDAPIASLLVTKLRSGGYGNVLFKDPLAKKFYDVSSSPEKPVRFYVNKDAYYVVYSDGSAEVVQYSIVHSDERIQKQLEAFSQMPLGEPKAVVTISPAALFDDTVNLLPQRPAEEESETMLNWQHFDSLEAFREAAIDYRKNQTEVAGQEGISYYLREVEGVYLPKTTLWTWDDICKIGVLGSEVSFTYKQKTDENKSYISFWYGFTDSRIDKYRQFAKDNSTVLEWNGNSVYRCTYMKDILYFWEQNDLWFCWRIEYPTPEYTDDVMLPMCDVQLVSLNRSGPSPFTSYHPSEASGQKVNPAMGA